MAVPAIEDDYKFFNLWHGTLLNSDVLIAELRAKIIAEGANATEIIELWTLVTDYGKQIQEAFDYPGMQAILRSAYQDPVFDIVAEKASIDANFDGVTNTIELAMPICGADATPSSVVNKLAIWEFSPTTGFTPDEFSAAALLPLTDAMNFNNVTF